MFLRKSRLEPLPVTMTGVRMGERLLQIGIDDPATVAALAKKIGLSGVNALAAFSEQDAERARSAASAAGVLIEVQTTPSRQLLFAAGSFDIVVIHGVRGLLAAATPTDRAAMLQESRRVLRKGGRIVVIEAGRRGGLAALFRSHDVEEHYARAGGAERALKAEGFHPVRILGEAEGLKFTEGLKT